MHDQVMHAFATICGQNPATSPFVLGYQGPLCWRCTGIYVALACAVVVARRSSPAPRAFLAHLGLAAAALAVLAVDVFAVQARFHNNVTRFATGAAAGWALGVVLAESAVALFTTTTTGGSIQRGGTNEIA